MVYHMYFRDILPNQHVLPSQHQHVWTLHTWSNSSDPFPWHIDPDKMLFQYAISIGQVVPGYNFTETLPHDTWDENVYAPEITIRHRGKFVYNLHYVSESKGLDWILEQQWLLVEEPEVAPYEIEQVVGTKKFYKPIVHITSAQLNLQLDARKER